MLKLQINCTILVVIAIFLSCSNAKIGEDLSSEKANSNEVEISNSLPGIDQTTRDTLPSELTEAIFRSDYYKDVEQQYGSAGNIVIFVVPGDKDSLISFQLSVSTANRMQPLKNLKYSKVSKLVYEYDVFSDSLRVVWGI